MPEPKDLPNVHGFEFIGITAQGRRKCYVVFDEKHNTYYVDGEAKYCDLTWWQSKQGKE